MPTKAAPTPLLSKKSGITTEAKILGNQASQGHASSVEAQVMSSQIQEEQGAACKQDMTAKENRGKPGSVPVEIYMSRILTLDNRGGNPA